MPKPSERKTERSIYTGHVQYRATAVRACERDVNMQYCKCSSVVSTGGELSEMIREEARFDRSVNLNLVVTEGEWWGSCAGKIDS